MTQKIKLWLLHKLNRFCFSDKHDDYCSGCIFKNCAKCPLNTIAEKIEKTIWVK